MDIDIELLQLNIAGASGQEHRIRSIAARAAEILAARLETRYSGRSGRGQHVPRLSGGAVELDLSHTGDERAALSIAAAWINALSVKLEAGG